MPIEESVGALVDLQAAGKIRSIGLSNVTIDELNRAAHLTPILSVQNRYNLRDRASEDVLRHRLSAPAVNADQALYASKPLPQTGRLMLKDEDLCVHCGLCAERCPTAAWDMQKFELLIGYAGQVNPTESCTAA